VAGSVGALGGCAHQGDHTWVDWVFPDCHQRFFLAARSAVGQPLGEQALNGSVLEATLYNYHFKPDRFETVEEEIIDEKTGKKKKTGNVIHRRLYPPDPTEVLLPAGVGLVQRLARQQTGPVLRLYVQTANEHQLKQGKEKPETAYARRDELNRERVESVKAVLAAVRPDLIADVVVIDPDEVGMSAKETQVGLLKLEQAPEGKLSRDEVLGLEIGAPTFFGGGGAAPSSPPSPPSVPPPTPSTTPGAAPGGLSPAGG
jgi:hypothetical protein